MSNLFSSGGAGNVGFSGETQQSLKFNDDESQYLSWTPAGAGNRKTWTWSAWVKRGTLGATQGLFASDGTSNTTLFEMFFSGGDQLGAQGSSTTFFRTNQLFRDTSAWYHIVLKWDAANTNADLYVNGVEVTSWSTAPNPSNQDYGINNNVEHYLGSRDGGANPFDGYLSDVHFIDGQALDASSFGQFTNGYWEAKDYAGTYGTNGFHLTFQDDVVSEGFNTVTYRGTGATQSISGLGFEPDLVWIKDRSFAYNHQLFDTIRGSNASLLVNATNAETNFNSFASFDADGFTLTGANGTNASGNAHVAWCWDAGSGSAASNTDGTITSSVKANPDYGFSIVTFEGTSTAGSVGHGLSSAPKLVIAKNRDSVTEWPVYHDSVNSGGGSYLRLNSTAANASSSIIWTDSPSSTVVNIGTYEYVNRDSMVFYCFAEVAGYSSIGSYTGSGVSNLSVTTGFRPAFILWKGTNTNSWFIVDNTRSPVTGNKALFPDLANAESASADRVIFTDTGFTIPNTNGNQNASGVEYIYMAFADTREAAFWKDVSGQGNHWTPNSLDYRDSVIDSPANNWCTLNPIYTYWNPTYPPTISEGNLKTYTASNYWATTLGTIGVSSGKWYAEFIVTTGASPAALAAVGILDIGANNAVDSSNFIGYETNSVSYYAADGNKFVSYTSTSTYAAYGNAWGLGDIIGVALDLDAGTVKFYKNNTVQNSGTAAASSLSGTFVFGCAVYATTAIVANFGQDSTFSGIATAGGNQDDNGIGDFYYAPPAGHLALCTANLPTPTIIDAKDHFSTLLWTGDAAQTRSLSGLGFEPDFSWLKIRSGTTQDHQLYDVVRGAGSGKSLSSNTSAVEGTVNGFSDGDYGYLSSFDADGFSVDDGAVATTGGYVNYSGRTYVAWNWKAGGTAVSNTDGSITSQVSANTDAGFSIVSYTGNATTNATIGHGLGVAPDFIIHKNRSVVDDWSVWSSALPNTTGYKLYLNSTSAELATSNYPTLPTSSVFYVGAGQEVNGNTHNMIAYCFANTDGYLKAGSYTGNGSSDGPMVFTGGRPSWFLVKRSDSGTHHWRLFDAARSTFNEVDDYLAPSNSNTEAVGKDVDFVSNGVKIRTTDTDLNTSGGTYIYLCIMESPQSFANAR